MEVYLEGNVLIIKSLRKVEVVSVQEIDSIQTGFLPNFVTYINLKHDLRLGSRIKFMAKKERSLSGMRTIDPKIKSLLKQLSSLNSPT